MVAIIINEEIKTYSKIPSVWNGVINYSSVNNSEQQYTDGWRDVIQPSYNAETQKRGDIYFDEENDVFTYEVIDKSPEEIQSQITAEAEATKQQLIQQKVEAQTGDKVHFPTATDPVYECLIPNNVYSPITYPQGWQLVE